jgi:hypothetical protein
LLRVWKRQRGSLAQRIAVLNTNKSSLGTGIKSTATAYKNKPEGSGAKKALGTMLDDYYKELDNIKANIASTQVVELESKEFVNWAIDFVTKLKDNWWNLSFDSRKKGEQILFNY